jgi:hypothetical protein
MLYNPTRGTSIARSIQRLSRPHPSFHTDRRSFVLVHSRAFGITMSNRGENRSYSVSRSCLELWFDTRLMRYFRIDRKQSSCSTLVNLTLLRESRTCYTVLDGSTHGSLYCSIEALRKSGGKLNQYAIPDMIEYLRRIGYRVSLPFSVHIPILHLEFSSRVSLTDWSTNPPLFF